MTCNLRSQLRMVFMHYLQVLTSEVPEEPSKVHENQTFFGCFGSHPLRWPPMIPDTWYPHPCVVPSPIVPGLICVINRSDNMSFPRLDWNSHHGFHFGCSFFLSHVLHHNLSNFLLDCSLSGKSSHAQPCEGECATWQLNVLLTAMWMCLEVEPSVPVESSETAALVNSLTAKSQETLNQNTQPQQTLRNGEMNVCHIKQQSCGVICYPAVDN